MRKRRTTKVCRKNDGKGRNKREWGWGAVSELRVDSHLRLSGEADS